MSNQKKQIILNEITFWKQNKLLPEHYCDFLTTLYTEGERQVEIEGKASQSVMAQQKRKALRKYSVMPMIAIIFIVLLFTIDAVWLVAILTGALAVGCLVGAFYLAKKNQLLSPILHLTGALLLLAVTVQICMTYFPNSVTILYVGLLINCLLWFISGLTMKIVYFTVSGILGMLAIAIYFFI
ncbi:hypothetical protein P9B03_15750 [Metasolibacillus meyeri]|uniref:DUF1700 domain-containing protein n=1 Tax=Metasolibacillus meyeri TaxID=1071052 RepID=A0AAW9NVL2_9BACL|nr:hypothetical protein [Metasolibacillus meyeri]MEC1179954.1 hypothetical protein [Metasolibacillus meyeri]